LSITYDAQRQLPKMNYFTKTGVEDNQKGAKFYTATPYIITFELNVYAKQHNDALQVVEQILPYFAPQYTVSFKPIEDYPDIKEDVPVILQSVAFTDNFEGQMEDRRTIIYTLTFDMKVSFYGPKPTESPLITRVDADLFNMDVNSLDSDRYLETVRSQTTTRPISPDSDYTLADSVLDSDSPISLPHAYE